MSHCWFTFVSVPLAAVGCGRRAKYKDKHKVIWV